MRAPDDLLSPYDTCRLLGLGMEMTTTLMMIFAHNEHSDDRSDGGARIERERELSSQLNDWSAAPVNRYFCLCL